MKYSTELFWQASVEEIKKGFVFNEDSGEFVCLICNKAFEDGRIYPHGDALYTAERAVKAHIKSEHQSSFHFLLGLNKRLTGLTDHQKAIVELFAGGYNDKEVAQRLGIGSTSTIRNHRFTLKEKQKQAKVLLAILELMGEMIPRKSAFIDVPVKTRHIDERFAVTHQESQAILSQYLPEGPEGPLKAYPQKEKKRVVILRHLAKGLEPGRTYTEKQVNAYLERYYQDYVLLRRNLVDYGFLDRLPDGSAYWVKV